MKRLLIILSILFFTTDSFASGIASNTNSAPCTNNTLETYSGNSNLSADWQPNTINLRWYNGNTLLDVQSSANTCVYDGTLTVPSTAPTRVGYTFDGWQVRPEMDFSTINTSTNGTERWAKEPTTKGTGQQCSYGTIETSTWNISCDNDNTFKELQILEWKVRFEHGDLYGIGGCSDDGEGTHLGQSGEPVITNKTGQQYCWCKVTGYKASSSDIIYAPSDKLPWIWRDNYTYCTNSCAFNCAYTVRIDSNYRKYLLTPVNN